MNSNDIAKEIDALNSAFHEATGTEDLTAFSMGYAYCHVVTFMSVKIWNDDDDERPWDDDKDEAEPLRTFLWRRAMQVAATMSAFAKNGVMP